MQIDGIDEDFGVVHAAPADETPVVGEGGELVVFDIFMNSLFDVKVFAGHGNIKFCNLINLCLVLWDVITKL